MCACFVAGSQKSPALAATVIANDYIQFVRGSNSRYTIRIGTDTFSHAFAVFEYSGHSFDLLFPSLDHQYYRIANFDEVFNPVDPRVERGLADGGLGEVGTGDFYIGVWLVTGSSPFTQRGQYYGWVHLRPVDGMLTMVANAMSFNSRGIVVGTLQVVPEPASAAIAVVGLVALLKLRICRLRRRTAVGLRKRTA
jgi:hypothetical protein